LNSKRLQNITKLHNLRKIENRRPILKSSNKSLRTKVRKFKSSKKSEIINKNPWGSQNLKNFKYEWFHHI